MRHAINLQGLVMFLIMAAVSAGAGHGPIPYPAPIRHPVDEALRLSEDGQVLVWVRIREAKLSICAWVAPFAGKPDEILLDPYAIFSQDVQVSLDGRHVFWPRDGWVWYAPLTAGRFGPKEKLPVNSGPFGLQVNADGTVLATLVDGPPLAGRDPGNRVLYIAERDDQGWTTSPHLTPADGGELAWLPLLDGAGQSVIVQSHGITQARRQDQEWQTESISFPGYDLKPVALSADGLTMVLRGRKADEPAPPAPFVHRAHVWVSRRTDDHWQTPVLVLRDQQVNYYHVTMSPDGSWLAWTRYDRDADGNGIVRTRICQMKRQGDAWAEHLTTYEFAGWKQVWCLCIANDGTAGWTMIDGPDTAWRGYVRSPGENPISLD